MSGHQYDEGHTIAGWTGCVIATAGAAVAGVGIVGWRPGIWVGSVIMASAALVVWGLHLAGWGKPPGVRATDQWGLRVRDRSARQGHAGCLWCRLAGRRGDPVRAVAVPNPAVPASRSESQADQLS
ncbi:HGxxPAAW family protein [Streptomyces sp. NPDC059863]|uniref:HGxxPAAW family protein n=1 Tax=unclassified Streptomyces TaxID=2593676 RepID=UPI00365CBE7C